MNYYKFRLKTKLNIVTFANIVSVNDVTKYNKVGF